jgi:hypothetical protein
MIRYGIWHDEQQQDYSIIRWDNQDVSRNPYLRGGRVVQTGIRTLEKAQATRQAWEEREAIDPDAAPVDRLQSGAVGGRRSNIISAQAARGAGMELGTRAA